MRGIVGRSAMRDIALARTSDRKTVVIEKHMPIASLRQPPCLSRDCKGLPSIVNFNGAPS